MRLCCLFALKFLVMTCPNVIADNVYDHMEIDLPSVISTPLSSQFLVEIQRFNLSSLSPSGLKGFIHPNYSHINFLRDPSMSGHEYADFVVESRHAISVLTSEQLGRGLLSELTVGDTSVSIRAGLTDGISMPLETGARRFMNGGWRNGNNGKGSLHPMELSFFWNAPADRTIGGAFGDDMPGGVYTPRYIMLAHELIHGRDHRHGVEFPMTPTGIGVNNKYIDKFNRLSSIKRKHFTDVLELMREGETVGLLDVVVSS